MHTYNITLPCILLIGFHAKTEAVVYTDPLGDTSEVSGHHMDIESVEVINDEAFLYFTLRVGDNAGFPMDTYARYMVAFDTVPGGESSANAWHNLVTMPGMDYFGGGWTGDDSGINFYSAALGGWPEWLNNGNDTWIYFSPSTMNEDGIQFHVDFGSLALQVGDTFAFDVYTGWDGKTATDALGLSDGTATQLDGSTPYDSSTNVLTYTITLAETWGGFDVFAESGTKTVDTGTFLGWLEVTEDPWVYSYSLEKYIFLPEGFIDESGAWSYIPNFED